MKQLTIFDVLPAEKPKDIPCGHIEDKSLVGKEIRFTDLKAYIGKKVVKAYEGGYKVYKVIEYIENCDTYYKRVRPLPDNALHYGEIVNDYIHDICGQKEAMKCYEPYFTCDRLALSDKEGSNQANTWISEAYCSNGRFKETSADYSTTFHELLTSGNG